MNTDTNAIVDAYTREIEYIVGSIDLESEKYSVLKSDVDYCRQLAAVWYSQKGIFDLAGFGTRRCSDDSPIDQLRLIAAEKRNVGACGAFNSFAHPDVLEVRLELDEARRDLARYIRGVDLKVLDVE